VDIYQIEKVPLRLIIYSLGILYLGADLLLHGPLYQNFQAWIPGSTVRQQVGIDNNWAASVGGYPITKAQLNLGVDIHLARRGKTREELSKKNLSIVQLAVLNEMINDEFVRQFSMAQPVQVPPEFTQKRIDQFMASFAPEQLKDICKANGLTQDGLLNLLKAQARQEYWLEEMIKGGLGVKEQDVRAWYEAYKEVLVIPEVVRARHIFLSTVGQDVALRETEIREIRRQLTAGEASFEDLCAKVSEDDRTKNTGGDLNYFSRERMPKDFCDPVFELEVGEISQPIQTSIGWHIVEVTEKKPKRQRTFEEAAPEIRATLENEKRQESIDEFLNVQLRGHAKVEFYPAASVLDGR